MGLKEDFFGIFHRFSSNRRHFELLCGYFFINFWLVSKPCGFDVQLNYSYFNYLDLIPIFKSFFATLEGKFMIQKTRNFLQRYFHYRFFSFLAFVYFYYIRWGLIARLCMRDV